MIIMKFLVKLFLVVLIVGVAVSNEEGGAKSDTAERVCPPEILNDLRTPVYLKVPQILISCFAGLKNKSIFRSNNATAEEIQSICNEICSRHSDFRDCLEEKAAHLEVCPDPEMLKVFNIGRDLAIKIFDGGCEDGAKRLFALLSWINDLSETSPIFGPYQKCAFNMVSITRQLDVSKVDISSKVFIIQKEFIKFVKCINRANDDQSYKQLFDYFSNEVLATMKCIHPQDGALVPCVSISVDQLSAPSVCEVMTHSSELVMYDILEEEAVSCYNYFLTLDKRIKDITSDNEAFREEMKQVCIRRRIASDCPNEAKVISETCLNETQNNEFKLLVDSVQIGLSAACLEDGKRLADLMFEVYRLKRTGQGHAVWDCIDAAKSTRNELDEHRSSSMNMRFYHELETFKGCLINKLGGDVTSVASATSLIDETLKKIECVSVTDGTTVTCESLMHHHH